MTFYDRFELLCEEKGITPTQAGRDNGIAQGVVSMWKKRGSVPKVETVQKLADYFEVSIGFLIGDSPITFTVSTEELKEHLGRRAQAKVETKDYVQGRFTDAETWKSRKDEIGKDLAKLNDNGQIEAVKRVKELTQLDEYRRKSESSPLSTGIKVYGGGPAGSFPPVSEQERRQEPQEPSPVPPEGKDTTPPVDGSEGPAEGK